MQIQHTPKTGDGASLSRRTFMSLTATSAAMTLPAAALVDAATLDIQAAELPIEVFDRHAFALSEVLNTYLDGEFYACIYPSRDYDNPVCLKSIAAERRPALPLEQQLDACVAKLKAILAQMHPDVENVHYRYTPFNDDRSYFLSLVAHAPLVGGAA